MRNITMKELKDSSGKGLLQYRGIPRKVEALLSKAIYHCDNYKFQVGKLEYQVVSAK